VPGSMSDRTGPFAAILPGTDTLGGGVSFGETPAHIGFLVLFPGLAASGGMLSEFFPQIAEHLHHGLLLTLPNLCALGHVFSHGPRPCDDRLEMPQPGPGLVVFQDLRGRV